MARLNKLGDFALRLESVLSAFLPSAPTALVASGGDGTATLSWTPSVTLLQLPATDYQSQYSEDGVTWVDFPGGVGSPTTMTVTGLAGGTSYFFRVRGVNRVGAGPYSSATTATLIGLPPSAPTALAATAGERTVSLTWSAPASSGGVAIADYQIERSEDGGVSWVAVTRAASTSTSHTVTGLRGQVPCQFRVRAVNGIGPGAWSGVANATPVSYDDYWDDVALLLKMEGNGTSFADSSTNNTTITSVGLSQSTTQKKWGTKSADFSTTSTYLTVANGPSTALAGAFTVEMWVYWKTAPTRQSHLFHGANNSTEGRNMSFLVTASNGQGLQYGRSWQNFLGAASPVQFVAARWYHIAVVREADFRIRLFVDGVQINTQMLTDLWSGSGSLSGRMFIGYPARSPSAFIDEFRVTKRARYSANFTPPDEPFPTSKRPQAPAAPASVTLTPGSGSLTASWPPAAGATGYVVEYQQDGGGWVSAGSVVSATATVSGLTTGETYTVRVAGTNAAGQGAWATSAPLTLLFAPGQVTGLTAVGGHQQACLSWTAPDGDVTDYTVQYNSGSGWQTFSHPASTNTFISVTGLTNGVSYSFRVAATNSQSSGADSATASATPALILPAAPTAVSGTAGSGQVSLTWTPPVEAACRVLTSYLISYSADSGASWTTLSPQPTTGSNAVVAGLQNGTAYVFRVAYQSAAGAGPWSTPSDPATPVGLPSPPVSVTGAAGDGQVEVTWIAGNNGGSPVTDFLLQYSADQATWTQVDDGQNTATSYTVVGLTNGTTYFFRVSTRTATGDSAPAQSAPVTPAGLPTAPGTPSGAASEGQVSLTWTASSANGSAIVGYQVEFTTGGVSQTVSTGSPNASAIVSSLTNGLSYTFRVRAVNGVGNGDWSAASSPILVQGTPGAPTAVTGTIGDGVVALTWSPPSNTGGSAITDYTVEYTPSGGSPLTATATSSPYTLSGLANGTTYSIRVAANNSIGRGAYTTAITRTPATTPGGPTGFTATRGSVSGRLALAWTAPASSGGSAITSYTVEYTPSGGSPLTVSTGAVTSYNLDGLTDGTSYSVRVRAVNAIGAGGYSSAATATPGAVPGVPTSLAGTIADGSVALSWTAPANTGGFAITNYTVEYTPSGGSPSTVTASSSPYTLSGLTNGTTYSIRVAANNSIGRGAYTTAITRTPITTPAAPTGLTATGGTASGRLALAWTAPASSGGSAITSYTVEYTASGGSPQTVTTGSTDSSYNLDGLTNGTSYSVRVRAVNAIGGGAYGSPASGSPFYTPAAPTGVTGTTGNARVSLEWASPDSNGSAITDYIVEYSANSGSSWTAFPDGSSSNTVAVVSGLTNGTSYLFRVAAVNGAGQGPFSDPAGPLTPSLVVLARYLLVGGGGAGGGNAGGGGGGGEVSTASGVSLTPGTAYTVTIGAGGTGTTANGGNGEASSFSGGNVTIIATGGGGGGGLKTGTPSLRAGASGASGGGGGGDGPDGSGPAAGGSGAPFAGGSSGSSPTSCTRTGGGGGGSSSAGEDAVGRAAGNGGSGTESNISGVTRFYAGGGGGGGAQEGNFGCPAHTAGIGSAGGGNGSVTNSYGPQSEPPWAGDGQAALANSGSGGGGGAFSGSNDWLGGNGGSGIFIIRTNVTAASTTGSPEITTVGADTVYTFKNSGTITF